MFRCLQVGGRDSGVHEEEYTKVAGQDAGSKKVVQRKSHCGKIGGLGLAATTKARPEDRRLRRRASQRHRWANGATAAGGPKRGNKGEGSGNGATGKALYRVKQTLWPLMRKKRAEGMRLQRSTLAVTAITTDGANSIAVAVGRSRGKEGGGNGSEGGPP